jgi:tetratricopeptide (TPR) repeat protein
MVDFSKLLTKKKPTKALDPISIFNDLDKESGKEYLRPPQEAVLVDWHENWRSKRDVIVKLHTGQGKTLIGLLMLQSSLNEGIGPVLYICPNNYLVNQTIEQAREFGIGTVQFTPRVSRPPQAFLNSNSILVTNCNKLFNGKSVFGVVGSGKETINLGALVMDDAHKCLDIIREAFSIKVDKTDKEGKIHPIYAALWDLFHESLRRQAPGTCSDIASSEPNSLMAVPFWTWHDRQKEVLALLQEHKERDELLFVWDLLKDRIEQSICLFSGTRLEIAPRLLPVDLIPSFSQAKKRIFLSATLTEDAFLVRDLQIDPESVSKPLSSGDVKYCGERLIVIPSLVDPTQVREKLISWVSHIARKHGNFGVVTITPSFEHVKLWEKYGASVTNVQNLEQEIANLRSLIKKKEATKVMIVVNEYDGVDLPDSTCRILTLDSLPTYSSLTEKFAQEMRPTSGIIRRHLAQRVEQGMGRAIRGSSDWCIVVVIGSNLTNFISEHSKRMYLSKEAQLQIRIGEELANEMKQEGTQLQVVEKLVNQVLNRDGNWKEYYKERMSELEIDAVNTENLKRTILERNAENLCIQGNYEKATEVLRELIQLSEPADEGWYLQLMATYLYPINRTKSMDLQLKAHSENNRLFRPETGISYLKLTPTGTSRASLILKWIHSHESFNALLMNLTTILDKVVFGAPSELFEEGIDELGIALGFSTQRPEKALGTGPDNLWNIEGKKYWTVECKSMVSPDRKEITKKEAGQLANTIGWFKENYEDLEGQHVLVHPSIKLAKDAFVPVQIWCLDHEHLEKLKKNVRGFYTSMQDIPIASLSVAVVKTKLSEYGLEASALAANYLKNAEKHQVTK